MSEPDIWFTVSIDLGPGAVQERDIGPYHEEDLDKHGNPPARDVDEALWEMIGDRVDTQRKE